MANRVRDVELAPDTVTGEDHTRAPSPATSQTSDIEMITLVAAADDEVFDQPPVPDADVTVQVTIVEVLAISKVYQRVHLLEVDAVSHISTTRSHGWSALSGISSSQVSMIGVICLPLTATELVRFRDLIRPDILRELPVPRSNHGPWGAFDASLMSSADAAWYAPCDDTMSWDDTACYAPCEDVMSSDYAPWGPLDEDLLASGPAQNLLWPVTPPSPNPYDSYNSVSPARMEKNQPCGSNRRIHKELMDMGRDPASCVSAGPMDDNFVSMACNLSTLLFLTTRSLSGKLL